AARRGEGTALRLVRGALRHRQHAGADPAGARWRIRGRGGSPRLMRASCCQVYPPAPKRFCRVGRRTAEGRIGNTVEAFDESTRQKALALRAAPRRPPAVSPRLLDIPASRCARLLADRTRRRATQAG